MTAHHPMQSLVCAASKVGCGASRSSSRDQCRTAVMGFESGPLLLMTFQAVAGRGFVRGKDAARFLERA
jgi:hypothetical protein